MAVKMSFHNSKLLNPRRVDVTTENSYRYKQIYDEINKFEIYQQYIRVKNIATCNPLPCSDEMARTTKGKNIKTKITVDIVILESQHKTTNIRNIQKKVPDNNYNLNKNWKSKLEHKRDI